MNYDILAGRDGVAKLYSRFGWLYRTALDHDGPPTQGMHEVEAELTSSLRESQSGLSSILETDVTRLNQLATQLGLGYVILPD